MFGGASKNPGGKNEHMFVIQLELSNASESLCVEMRSHVCVNQDHDDFLTIFCAALIYSIQNINIFKKIS